MFVLQLVNGLPWLTSSAVETLTSKAIYPWHLSHYIVMIYTIGMAFKNIEYMNVGVLKILAVRLYPKV
jgi:hypothetical protein